MDIKQPPKLSNLALLIIRHAKQPNFDPSVNGLRALLAVEYTPDMYLSQIYHHVLTVYVEAVRIPEFRIPENNLFGITTNFTYGRKQGDLYTFEQVIEGNITAIMSVLRNTYQGWCRDQLYGEEPSKPIINEKE